VTRGNRPAKPEAYLRDLFTRLGEHPINRLAELLPWIRRLV